MVTRRTALLLRASPLAVPLTAEVRAEQPSKADQLGCLYYGSPVEAAQRIRALRTGLLEHGYEEGKNIKPELRWAETVERTVIAELSLKHRLAGMFGAKENVDAGGLILYFADNVDLTRRAAVYIDKILKGAKPADLPVEQASKYELIINLKTAKPLGLTIPPSPLLRADQVIE
jgi:hypothetical protein